MKIFSASQIKQADKITISKQNITSLELMERAATRVFQLIHQRLKGAPITIHVFCGLGNNGGDGLVLSRLLLDHGYKVTTYIVNFSEHRSDDFLKNYDRLKSMNTTWPTQLKAADDFPIIDQKDIVIDAIFGIGLNRPVVSWVGLLIEHINTARCFVLSIDIPSGLFMDQSPENPKHIIQASLTVTFQLPKLIFFLPETGKYSKDLEVIDIGLDADFINTTEAFAELVGKPEALSLYQPRSKYDHKGTYGHALLIGGSYGKMGSMVLSTEAALRSGAGLVTSFIPECGYNILQSAVPEAMVLTDPHQKMLSEILFDVEPSVIGVGMGLGLNDTTVKAFHQFLKDNNTPLVVDADAINILSKNNSFLELLPKKTVLTPHPGELERLIGSWKDDFDKIEKVKEVSKKYDLIVLVKGANTLVIYQNDICVNTSGNPGMATAGSGDVLTGVITGLVSQGYDPLVAAVFGAYLHGSAGDLGLKNTGYQGLIARDIVSHIGPAFLELFSKDTEVSPS